MNSLCVALLSGNSLYRALAMHVLLWLSAAPGFAQLGYYISRSTTLPDTVINDAFVGRAYNVGSIDIRSAAMGSTHITDRRYPGATNENPALLAGMTGVGGSLTAVGSTPLKTLDAVSFVTLNQDEFEETGAATIEALQETVADFYVSGTVNPAISTRLRDALEYPQELLNQVVGDLDNPALHGANINGCMRFQVGNFGFALEAYGESGFGVYMSPVYRDLARLYVQTDFSNPLDVEATLAEVQFLLDQVVDLTTGFVHAGSIPAIYGVTFSDITGTVGYGFSPVDSLSVGLNLKLLNRKFALSRIPVDDASGLYSELTGKLGRGTTGITGDIGALYRLPNGGELAMVIQNIIPFKTVSSSYEFSFEAVQLYPDRDSLGNVVVNAGGDTGWVLATRNVEAMGASDLSLPVVMDIGVSYPVLENWDVVIEVSDVLGNVSRFDGFTERLRLGTEYRLSLFGRMLQLAPRAGLAMKQVTAGLGLKLGGIVAIDAAYFPSVLENVEAVGAQVTVQF